MDRLCHRPRWDWLRAVVRDDCEWVNWVGHTHFNCRDSPVAHCYDGVDCGRPRGGAAPVPQCDGIVYALVARGLDALVEHAVAAGNSPAIAHRLLAQLEHAPDGTRRNFSHEGFVFHTMVKDGLTVICLADQNFGYRLPQAFLTEVLERFLAAHYSTLKSPDATRASFDPFVRVLRERMDFYSHDKTADRITSVKQDLEDTRVVMIKNLDKVLERGEVIETLVDKTSQLETHTLTFRVRSKAVRRQMCRRNCCLGCTVFCVLLVIAVVAVLVVLYERGLLPSPGHHDDSDDVHDEHEAAEAVLSLAGALAGAFRRGE
eukprot:m51a1_g14383 putative r- vamp71-family (317) ;mRNA; f:293967-295934